MERSTKADALRNLIMVDRLYCLGKLNTQIAEELGMGVTLVSHYISQLKKLDLSRERKRGRKARKTQRRLQQEQIIISVTNNGGNMEAVAREFRKHWLGKTREYVRIIIEDMRKEGIAPTTYTDTVHVRKAAETLGLRYDDVVAICRLGIIEYYELKTDNDSVPSSIFIKKKELSDLPIWIEIYNESRCPVCNKYFSNFGQKPCRATCSDECWNIHKKEIRKKHYESGVTDKNSLSFRVKTILPGPSDVWVTLAEAAEKTRLKDIQIRHLVRLKVLLARDHPTKKWRDKSVITVSLNQVEFVAKVYHGEIELPK